MKFDPSKTIKDGLKEFYKAQGINPEDNHKPINYFKIGPLNIPFPNFKSRQKVVYLHDINHILLNADTTFSEEGRVAAFELTSGFTKNSFIGYLYTPFALISGLIVAPIKTISAFRTYKGTKNSTHLKGAKSEILALKIMKQENY